MKRTLYGLLLACLLTAAHTAHAQRSALPVRVTIYTEDSFVNHHGSNANTVARRLFNDAANYYRSFYGVEMFLDGIVAPSFSTLNAHGGTPDQSGSILSIMRRQIPRVPPGTSPFNFDKYSNWFLVHRDMFEQGQGRASSIGGMGFDHANLWVSTMVRARTGLQAIGSDQRLRPVFCPDLAARVQTQSERTLNIIHEVGHLLGAQHTNVRSVMMVPGSATCFVDPFNGERGYWAEPTAPPVSMDQANAQRVRDHFTRHLSVAVPSR